MKTTIKLSGLTAKQQARFSKAEAKLPEGFYYRLHDEQGDHSRGDVWGVSVYNDGLDAGGSVGHVQKSMSAHTTCGDEHTQTVRLALNRAAAALWHKQPAWEN